MAPPMPRHKDDRLSVERSKAEFVRSRPERAFDPAPGDSLKPVDPIKAAAADDADDAAGHASSTDASPSILSRQRILNRRPGESRDPPISMQYGGRMDPGLRRDDISAGCATRSCAWRRRTRRSR